MINVEESVGTVIEGPSEFVIRGVLGEVAAHHDFLLHGQGFELAVEVHVQRDFGGVQVSYEVSVLHAAAIGIDAIATGLHPLVLRLVGFSHAHSANLESPIVIETVLQVGVERGDIDVRMVPLRPGVSFARQVDGFAVGVAREAADIGA